MHTLRFSMCTIAFLLLFLFGSTLALAADKDSKSCCPKQEKAKAELCVSKEKCSSADKDKNCRKMSCKDEKSCDKHAVHHKDCKKECVKQCDKHDTKKCCDIKQCDKAKESCQKHDKKQSDKS